jgi:hypothetical protein
MSAEDRERDGWRGVLEDAPQVDDDGFTARVMAALPPPRGRLLARVRSAILFGSAAAACGGAYALHGPRGAPHAIAAVAERAHGAPFAAILSIGVVLLAVLGALASATVEED